MTNKNNKTPVTTSGRYQHYSALLAFIIWGSWAYYINDYSGFKTQLTSGIAQGVASLIITLIIVHLITKIFNHLPHSAWRSVLSATITVSITGTGLVLMHKLIGTQKILYTIAPALSVAFIFAFITALKLSKH